MLEFHLLFMFRHEKICLFHGHWVTQLSVRLSTSDVTTISLHGFFIDRSFPKQPPYLSCPLNLLYLTSGLPS